MKSPSVPHVPVLLTEVLAVAEGLDHPPLWALDGTFGRGGHTSALLAHFPQLKIIGLDRDASALAYGREKFSQEIQSGRLSLVQGNFHDFAQLWPSTLESVTGGKSLDLILLDLGVSSPQLDESERGFSFYQDGPLDMRMDQSQGQTAADVVNTWGEQELTELFQTYGEIRRPQRVVQKIIEMRRQTPFLRTSQLSGLIERVEGWQRKGHHPATRYFLALRLEVNEELSHLEPCLTPMMEGLSRGGRLVIITFHSLEDRIIKYAFKERSELGFPVNKKVIVPSRSECLSNPRARSAKLRAFQRGPKT